MRRWLSTGSWLGRLMQRMATSSWFQRVGPVVVPPLDRLLARLTGGRFLLGSVLLPMIVLHTTGRRTGRERTTPLACLPTDEGYYVVGSNFGRSSHPAWSHNLVADPGAVVELRGETIPVRAHLLDDGEKQEVWPRLTELWPAFDGYAEKATGRELRVFRLEPIEGPGPATGRARP